MDLLQDEPQKSEKDWGMICHISALAIFVGIPFFIGPLVIWLLKKEESLFLDKIGRTALNYQLSALTYVVALGALYGLTMLLTIATHNIAVFVGIVFILHLLMTLVSFVLFLLWLVFTIVAAIKASKGESYTPPLTIPFFRVPK